MIVYSGSVEDAKEVIQFFRREVEKLHQGLRDQPGVAPQQKPFLAPQHPLRGHLLKWVRGARAFRSGRSGTGCDDHVFGESASDLIELP